VSGIQQRPAVKNDKKERKQHQFWTASDNFSMNPICALFSSYYAICYGGVYIFIVST
jgi:hypothetical protein